MVVYRIGKNLEKKDHWNNFKSGCVDGLFVIVVLALIGLLVFGVLSAIEFIVTTFKYWSILIFLILGVIGNGIKEFVRCKWFYDL